MINLKNKNCLITGASSGIGKALALKYAENQTNLFLVARNKNLLKKTRDEIKSLYKINVHLFNFDISNESSVKKILKFFKNNNLKIDYLINCAAVLGDGGKIQNISSKSWDYTIRVNLYGPFYLFKYLIPMLKINSLFINFSGGGGTLPQPFLDSYAASKAAVVRLTENVSLSYANKKITFVTISPGGINTKIFLDMKKLGRKKLGLNLWNEIKNRIKHGGDNIDNPLNLIIFLSKLIDRTAFNGRVISAKYDDWFKIHKNGNKIKKNDIFKLRRIDLTNSKYKI